MNFDSFVLGKNINSINRGKFIRIVNRLLRRRGLMAEVKDLPHHGTLMVTMMQRICYFHLISEVLHRRVPGDLVELGCFEGQSALIFQHLLRESGSGKELFLYDNFKSSLGLTGDIRARLIQNFKNAGLKLPKIVEGDFLETIPSGLPGQIAFLHVDCGFGGDPVQHKNVILHCLNSAYSRMPEGAIGVLMDYHDKQLTVDGADPNPGVKMACDDFFVNKPEKVYTLYGGDYSHGYFVKGYPGNG